MEFWHDITTRKSWEVLKRLSKERLNFIVIGGWAVYLWTKALKSKDVDIILKDFESLSYLKKKYGLKKNELLKKYESLINEVSVDIYVPYFSELVIPCEDLIEMAVSKEGFETLPTEILLILKQEAEMERRTSLKGRKDRIDIISLLISNIDFEKYFEIVKRYNLKDYPRELRKLVKASEEEFKYCGIEFMKIKKLKNEILQNLR